MWRKEGEKNSKKKNERERKDWKGPIQIIPPILIYLIYFQRILMYFIMYYSPLVDSHIAGESAESLDLDGLLREAEELLVASCYY